MELGAEISTDAVSARLSEFVRRTFMYAMTDDALSADTPLLEGGIIDSMGVMELVEYIGREFDIVLDGDEITEDNLRSIATITQLVCRKRMAA
jgi:acyl carrier protein